MSGRTLTTPATLAGADLVEASAVPSLDEVAARYAVAVTPAMARLIDRDDPASDPIGRQFLPDPAELVTRPDERADPIGDGLHSPLHGLVHRYPDRVLIKPTHACPVYCRFCFRREVVGPGGDRPMSAADLDAAFDYVAGRPEIFEIIVTGGDPLILSPAKLAALADRAAAIPHVKVLRFHSRVPVVAPARITAALVAALRRPSLATYVGVHANHPRELTAEAAAALARLAEAGIGLVSQSVLLAGVNDDADVLEALLRAFLALRVKPYYLHHLDRAPGTARFRVPIRRGQALMKALRGRLSGLAMPTYVLDIPGGKGKSPLGPDYLVATKDGWEIEDFRGGRTLVET